MTDLVVLGQDPRFGGGALAQMEAFWRAALELGRQPAFLHLERPGLATPPHWRSPLPVAGTRVPLARLDVAREVLGARALASRLGAARSAWVVATAATYGYAAARSGRPYACWVGTSLATEWRARRRHAGVARRLAMSANEPGLRRLERATLQRATRLYATSAASRTEVAAAGGLEESDVGILPIPVDVDSFSPLDDDSWSAARDRPVIVFVGRADDPRKNVALLLAAWPRVRELVPTARLRLVGASPAVALPDGVEAIGLVDSVVEHVRDASLFILPSFQEGFGIVVAEALAAGVPVVTTPSGGPEELVRASGGGRVLESFAPDELAETVTGLLGDGATLLRMRRAGRKYVVREHSPAKFRELLAQALRDTDET